MQKISCIGNNIVLWLKYINIFKTLNYQALLVQEELNNLDVCIVKMLLQQRYKKYNRIKCAAINYFLHS